MRVDELLTFQQSLSTKNVAKEKSRAQLHYRQQNIRAQTSSEVI